MRHLLLATRNAKKLAEMQRILGDQVRVVGLADVRSFVELPETGATFEENAVAKAHQAARETGEITLADDSGLSVEALNGMPGVLSARWAGRHGTADADAANNALLLAQLADVPDARRGAAFVCALALAVPAEAPHVVRGEWPGRIARTLSGSNGFGYDPLFIPAESDQDGPLRTSAQLAPTEKDLLSHRGRAIRAMLPYLRALLGTDQLRSGATAAPSGGPRDHRAQAGAE